MMENARVYLAQEGDDDVYKIGFTSQPIEKRLRQLSTGRSGPLRPCGEFLVPVSAGLRYEAFVHASLADLRVCREFFRGPSVPERAAKAVEEYRALCSEAAAVSVAPLPCKDEVGRQPAPAGQASVLLEEALLKRGRLAAAGKLDELRRAPLEEALRSRLQDVAEVTSSGGQRLARWVEKERTHLDVERLRRDHPELVQSYMRTVSYRTLCFD